MDFVAFCIDKTQLNPSIVKINMNIFSEEQIFDLKIHECSTPASIAPAFIDD